MSITPDRTTTLTYEGYDGKPLARVEPTKEIVRLEEIAGELIRKLNEEAAKL